MELNGYSLIEEIRYTPFSVLYKARKMNDHYDPGKLTYLIKKYSSDVNPEVIENELNVAQTIEETCPKSVIVPILEKFVSDDQVYIVMQFRKNGLFLSQIIEYLEEHYGEGQIPLKIIIELTCKILASLEVFHQYVYKDQTMGFLHLDINPGNIFFESADIAANEWGTVKFIDFGSCVDVENSINVLKNRQWFCMTDRYSAPEMVEQIYPHISKSTDIYSVCACMLRMCFGTAFDVTDTISFADKNFDCNRVFTFMFDAIVKIALTSPSYYRYQDAGQMREDLTALIKCMEDYTEGNYIEFLLKCYAQSVPIGYVQEMTWKPMNTKGYNLAVRELESMLRKDVVSYTMCRYIFDVLYYIDNHYMESNRSFCVSLLNSGLACYNYIGDSQMCVQLYEALTQYQDCMTIDAYIGIQLRYAVTLADCCRYEDALQMTMDIISGLQAFKDIAANRHTVHLTEFGRAYSAAGTYMAFLEKEHVLDYYKKALEEFQGNEGNRRITYSKVLHYAVQVKDQLLYDEFMEYMVGKKGQSLLGQFHILCDKRRSHFDMFIFLKGLYTFYIKDVDVQFLEEMHAYFKTLEKGKKEHPVQLIFKYGAMIFQTKGEEKLAKVYFRLAASRMTSGQHMNLYVLMAYQTKWIENMMIGKMAENKKLFEDFLEKTNTPSWMQLREKVIKENTLEFLLKHEYC